MVIIFSINLCCLVIHRAKIKQVFVQMLFYIIIFLYTSHKYISNHSFKKWLRGGPLDILGASFLTWSIFSSLAGPEIFLDRKQNHSFLFSWRGQFILNSQDQNIFLDYQGLQFVFQKLIAPPWVGSPEVFSFVLFSELTRYVYSFHGFSINCILFPGTGSS